MIVVGDELIPFLIFWHGKWTDLKFLYRIVSLVDFSLENSAKSIVCFLDLADYY
jgi:hypothetical protein